MSNALAIATATTALRNLLLGGIHVVDTDLADLVVTTRTLDAARKDVTGSSLNLFLYQAVVNAAWQNTDLPRQVRPGESGHPPLALNLHYLITAYGPDDGDQNVVNHRVLCAAMSVLHDHPVLSAAEIGTAVPGNDLADQIERIRLTPTWLTIDDMSKLWSAFQSQYRISAAYEVTVVLIDSTRPTRSAVPVLRRGPHDEGANATVGTAPTLREIRLPRSQPAALLGDEMTVVADSLAVTDTTLRFRSLVATTASDPGPPLVELTPAVGTRAGEVTVAIQTVADDPDAFARWAPGFYTVSARVTRPGSPTVPSNAIACSIAPTVTVTPNSMSPGPVNPGNALTLTCAPRLRDPQRARILFGDRHLEPATRTNPDPASTTYQTTPTTLTCTVPDVDAGTYLVRLRVDGVDSIPVVTDAAAPTMSFDPLQQVTVS